MDDYRKDSLYLDFSGVPVRPKLDKVYEIISKKINLDLAKVNCIQPSMTQARVIIELKTQSYVEELVAQHSLKHSIEHNNKHYAIPLVPYDNTVEVRVADLPSYVSTETIAKHLAPYGEVVSTREEVWKNFWPGLPTGVRLIRMRIKKTDLFVYSDDHPHCLHQLPQSNPHLQVLCKTTALRTYLQRGS